MPTFLSHARLQLIAAVAATLASGCGGLSSGPPVVRANDNRASAGRMRGDTLNLNLEVRLARWHPQADSGPYVDAPVFAEVGQAPQIPGPLIRVKRGTVIALRLKNSLSDSSLTVHGFATHPSAGGDSITLAPGEERSLQFDAGEPGTYLYRAVAGTVDWDKREREQLAGAFVVDSSAGAPNDRVIVLNIWGEEADSGAYRNALAINGKSWPYTERIDATVGDSVRWRVVNATIRPHPMHLHGFYYRIDAYGSWLRDSTYDDSQRRRVVTQVMNPGETMSMVWSPDRDGQWLFHCHISFHVIPDGARLVAEGASASHAHDALSADAGTHMAGLVLGMDVRAPASWKPAARAAATSLRLHVTEGKRRARAQRALGYVLQEGDAPPAADSLAHANPVLVTHVGRPVDITVLNRLKEPTAVHWHGIELESYSDGVAGWSGSAKRVAPLIAPGDSFVARLTLVRPGTFIYHTHLGDFDQMTSGLFGGLIVLSESQRYDPARDHIFVAGWDGPEDPPHLMINGDSLAMPVTYAANVAHRLRFVNIGVAVPMQVRLTRDTSLVTWRALAKDGDDLPAAQAVARPAELSLDVGETADFEFRPTAGARYVLTIKSFGKQEPYAVRIQAR
jgi:FtsP/CotA-like multicopper oxidase with cupredoxin domain